MGLYLGANFVAGYRRVGTFTAIRAKDSDEIVAKIGGNVALYFCTPDGRVLAAVAGVASRERVLEEARRAVSIAERAEAIGGDPESALRAAAAEAYADVDLPRHRRHAGDLGVDLVRWLTAKPGPPLEELGRRVWEEALGQRWSDAGIEIRVLSGCGPGCRR